MKYKHSVFAFLLSAGVASAANILTPSDQIIALAGYGSNSNTDHNGGESPSKVVDGDSNSKYLNFGGKGAGFIVTPASGSSTVLSLGFTTANDDPNRDPARYTLYGTNGAITSGQNSAGDAEAWTQIHSSAISLPTDRQVGGTFSDFGNGLAFSSYKVVFDTLRDNNNNLMQIADVQLYTGAGGTGSSVLAPGDSTVGVDFGLMSHYGGEGPGNILDASSGSKYLNYAAAGSGFIVTPDVGPTVAKGFTITTANDAIERDPASYSIYGTNEAIASFDNGDGNGESWSLIQSGGLSLTDVRETESDLLGLSNDASYTSYKVVFDSLKDGGAANSMQIGGFTLDTVPEPSAALLSLLGCAFLLKRRRG